MKDTSTLFIDESGKSSLAEKENEPFILTGVILKDIEIPAIEGFFNFIKRKFNIDPTRPFHSYHIYENPKTRISTPKALALSKSLAEYISLIPIDIQVVIISKSEFKNALGIKSNEDFKGDSKRKEIKQYPYRIMASYLFDWFGEKLEKDGSIGQIIADSRRGGDHQLLKTLHLCKESQAFNVKFSSEAIEKRINAICFAEKGFLSGGLEITDLVSYVTFFRARRLIKNQHDIGLNLIWEEIKNIATFERIKKNVVREFFVIKKGEVHKYLKT